MFLKQMLQKVIRIYTIFNKTISNPIIYYHRQDNTIHNFLINKD
jgi:hypothetical protein